MNDGTALSKESTGIPDSSFSRKILPGGLEPPWDKRTLKHHDTTRAPCYPRRTPYEGLTRLRTRDTVPQHDSAERNACTVPGQGMGKMRMHHQGKAASL